MRTTLLLLALVIASAYCAPTRILAWSNSQQIQGKGLTQDYTVVRPFEISSLLRTVATVGANSQSTFSQHFQAGRPDFAVIFLTSANALHYSGVKNALESFESSILFPYISGMGKDWSLVEDFIADINNAVLVGDSNLRIYHDSESIETVLQKVRSKELTNQVAVVDLIEMNIEEANRVIESFNEVLLGSSKGIAVLIQHSEEIEALELTKSKKQFTSIRALGDLPPYPTKWPAYIIEGMFVGIFLAFTAIIGVVCTCQIQTPLTFETKPKSGAVL